jgi:soluble lytic murein transglycosylase-like protein
MTEADNHPSQRRRVEPSKKNKHPDDVSSLLKAALVAGLFALFPHSAPALADVPQAASLGNPARQDIPNRPAIHLPSVLKAADVVRYRQIFVLQADARWPEADRLIAATENKLLLGHVQAQRYLHPRYRSRYQELTIWLAHYGDHPDAKRIHDLAMRRRPAQSMAPAIPDGGGKPPLAGIKTVATEAPAERWNPAIEAFRQKRYSSAARQFEAIARTPKASPWVISAAAFWTARSHLLGGRPQQVTEWLHRAAQNPLTFYGLLARETLGIEGDLDLREPYLHQADARALIAQPAGARAIALLQINDPRRAEPELASVTIGDSSSLARAVVALANYGNMPGLSLRIGNRSIGLDSAERDAAIYPIPSWSPSGGFQVDRALLYAIMRRESSFNPDAHNNASGASGLMQLMPATAKAVAGRSMPISKIAEPETNMALGQKYISRLLADPAVDGNLIRLAAAYNAGPGNMAKWQRQISGDDPLLFIESLPSRETRVFIETVLTDHWIYRMRLGQKTESLGALASGRWPMYVAQDRSDRTIAAAPQKSSAEATDAGH